MAWGMNPRYSSVAVPALCLLMGLTGCPKKEEAPLASAVVTPAAPGEKRWPLTGEVIEANAGRQVLIVTHDEIKDFMPAMTMEFKVAKSDLANAKPGQRIRAEMVDRGED